MNRLTERHLTRLSYLTSSIVVYPIAAIRFCEIIQREDDPIWWYSLLDYFIDYLDIDDLDRDKLKNIAAKMKIERDEEVRTLGYILDNSLQTQ